MMTANGFSTGVSTAPPPEPLADRPVPRTAAEPASPRLTARSATCQISIVVPVFNGADTLPRLMDEVQAVFEDHQFEVVLVNDGSRDDSERVCRQLVDRCPERVVFVQLSRNFGEHQAVLAGLTQARGQWVGILDDDGQNPPEELHRMWRHIQRTGDDVLYGRYRRKRHGMLRNLGSALHNRLAAWLIGKPAGLYLSSFKVMSRPLVNELTRTAGPAAYLDAAILRATARIGQVEVLHRERQHGRSGYTLGKLVRLSLAMCFGYSLWPLRLVLYAGVVLCLLSLGWFVALAVQHLWLQPGGDAWGLEALAVSMLCLSGVQLLSLGVVGEYIGRLWLRESGNPAFVVSYVHGGAGHD
jgi:undecaprenyl-phosphate 4-deoxy-4-formamido-L-arabinose transferase